jgi:hypothetical protein
MRRPLFLLACAVALLVPLLAGCPRVVRPTRPFDDAVRALDAHAALRARVRSLRAEARADQRGPEGRIRGTLLMFVERPDRVRVDVMTQFGPAAVLTSDGARFALSDLRERVYLAGRACASNIARLVAMPLTGADFGQLLLGGTPRIDFARAAIRVDPDDGRYRVVLAGRDGGRQEIDFALNAADADAPPEAQRLRLVRTEMFDPRGATLWRVTYDDYRVVRAGALGVAMPFVVNFEHPGRGAELRLRFEEIAVNVDVPEGAFAQTPAPGLTVREAGCDEDVVAPTESEEQGDLREDDQAADE